LRPAAKTEVGIRILFSKKEDLTINLPARVRGKTTRTPLVRRRNYQAE